MKKSLLKDIFREIADTRKRFISIFLIVLLGVGVFAGIKAASRDMKLTADKYGDDYNLMDIQIVSTLGLTSEDVDYIRGIKGVKSVQPGYSLDALVSRNNKSMVVKVNSLSVDKIKNPNDSFINRPKLVKGRLPESDTECVVEQKFIKGLGFSIGDSIELESGTNKDIKDTLKNNSFKIVGIVETPYYLSGERGSSTIGNGEIQAFIMIPENAFSMDVYTEVYATVENAKEFLSYDKQYEDMVKTVEDALEDLGKSRSEVRYGEVRDEAYKKINDAKKELADSEQKVNREFSDARTQLDAAKVKLSNSEKELNKSTASFYKQIDDGQKQIADGRKQLDDAEKELLDREKEMAGQEKMLNDAEEQLNFDSNMKSLDDVYAQLKAAADGLNAQINENPLLKPLLQPQLDYLNPQIDDILKKKQQLVESKNTLDAQREQLNQGKAQIAQGKEQIQSSRKELDLQEAKLNEEKANGKKRLDSAAVQISKGKSELTSREKEYEEGKIKAEKELNDAKVKIADSEKEINDIKKPEWYVLDRKANIGFVQFGQEADRVMAIGNVFPTIFFLVAALVSLTTMTRMVEKQRTQMGVLKALGYSKASIVSKYIIYSLLAALSGSAAGSIAGFIALPRIVLGAYRMMYDIPQVVIEFNMYYAITGTIIALMCTTLIAVLSCLNFLKESPASLMRLKAPEAGKRILLERIKFIWTRMGFTQKVTFRNLFRYKKRFLMTVLGIGGCTALLLTGFGIRDSVKTVVDKQFNEIFKYQLSATFKKDINSQDRANLDSIIKNNNNINDSMKFKQSSVDVSLNGKKVNAYIMVPEDINRLKDFIVLKNRVNGDSLSLTDDGVVITEKLSKLLKIKTGDSIYIKDGDDREVKVKVSGITENYLLHYVYMSPALYKSLYGEDAKYNQIIAKTAADSKAFEDSLSEEILKVPSVTAVNFTSSVRRTFENTMNNLLSIVVVLIVLAGALAFIVLYNLTNINISERMRELATMKVLGFYDNEVSSFVIRENMLLTLTGIAAGCIMGVFLHRFIMGTAEVDQLMFGRNVAPISFIYSALITLGFTTIVNLIVYFQLKKIDMIDSLKSNELE
jgi:Predicted permease.